MPEKSEFIKWCDELDANGYHILYGNGQAPTELHGFLPAGEMFYFRARGSTARFDVGFDNPDAARWSEVLTGIFWTVTIEDDTDNDYAYSWLKPEEAREMFEGMLQDYLDANILLKGLELPTQERIAVLNDMLMHDLVS